MGRERHAESGLDRSGDRLFELPSQERFVPRCRQRPAANPSHTARLDSERDCVCQTSRSRLAGKGAQGLIQPLPTFRHAAAGAAHTALQRSPPSGKSFPPTRELVRLPRNLVAVRRNVVHLRRDDVRLRGNDVGLGGNSIRLPICFIFNNLRKNHLLQPIPHFNGALPRRRYVPHSALRT